MVRRVWTTKRNGKGDLRDSKEIKKVYIIIVQLNTMSIIKVKAD